MGVTLERVQNKFACIIGELCNEPIVLSQFAIWVDLRIAEYKAKGAISLDCSGDDPDPTWMNGHRLPKRTERTRNSTSDQRRSRLSQNYAPDPPSDTGFLNEGRLSPEFLLIKEEPSGDSSNVFPVSIHPHNAPNPSPSPRKRPVSETLSRSDDNFYHQDTSAAKVQRLSSAGDTGTQVMGPDNTSNQSLISIISGDQNQTAADISSSDIEVILDYENKSTSHPSEQQQQQNEQHNSSIPSEPAASSSFDNNDSFYRENTNTSAGDRAAPTRLEHMLKSPVATSEENSVVRAISQSELLAVHKRNVKVRLEGTNCAGLAQTTQLNFIGAAAALECWLSLEKSDTRTIETIPPDELDLYLAEFFPLLKRRNGYDYDPESFSNFRSFLDRFLKEKNYPVSIRSMSGFPKSSAAFKARRKALGLSFTVKRMLQHQAQTVMPVDLSSSCKS